MAITKEERLSLIHELIEKEQERAIEKHGETYSCSKCFSDVFKVYVDSVSNKANRIVFDDDRLKIERFLKKSYCKKLGQGSLSKTEARLRKSVVLDYKKELDELITRAIQLSSICDTIIKTEDLYE